MFRTSHSAGAACLGYIYLYSSDIIGCSGLTCSAWSGSRTGPPISNTVDMYVFHVQMFVWEICACIGYDS